MILSKHEILKLVETKELVRGYIDLEKQLQPASFDLTLESIHSIETPAKIDFDNSQRVLSKTKKLDFKDDWIALGEGQYKIDFNEIVKLPAGVAGLTISRSSLGRSGAGVQSGWWDPGYHGRGGSLLFVGKQGIELKRNAKVAQMVFMRLSEDAKELYSGMHHKENLV